RFLINWIVLRKLKFWSLRPLPSSNLEIESLLFSTVSCLSHTPSEAHRKLLRSSPSVYIKCRIFDI
ncbi:hypothetical protein S83_001955, partial [Arachis hypogaea]